MRKIFLTMLITIIFFSFLACKKKEEEPASKSLMPQGPIIDTPGVSPGHGTMGPNSEFQVVVPSEVKERWSAVVFIIDDKKENKKREVKVNIGGEFKIPGSDLTIKTGPFLPDFKMSGQIITSASDKPNNPSVGVAIYKDGKQIFPSSGKWGWLYINFPTIHSFQHERYGLTLKEGIEK
jgi:hypothetical protein